MAARIDGDAIGYIAQGRASSAIEEDPTRIIVVRRDAPGLARSRAGRSTHDVNDLTDGVIEVILHVRDPAGHVADPTVGIHDLDRAVRNPTDEARDPMHALPDAIDGAPGLTDPLGDPFTDVRDASGQLRLPSRPAAPETNRPPGGGLWVER